MRAIILEKFGGLDSLVYRDIPEPEPKAGHVVIEIKASADPDLPFQALDYWIAVERHRRAHDFENKGYFAGCDLLDEPALLVLVAPLLAFHKTAAQMIAAFPPEVPLMEIGINQTWKKQIKILRRQGMVS